MLAERWPPTVSSFWESLVVKRYPKALLNNFWIIVIMSLGICFPSLVLIFLYPMFCIYILYFKYTTKVIANVLISPGKFRVLKCAVLSCLGRLFEFSCSVWLGMLDRLLSLLCAKSLHATVGRYLFLFSFSVSFVVLSSSVTMWLCVCVHHVCLLWCSTCSWSPSGKFPMHSGCGHVPFTGELTSFLNSIVGTIILESD